MTRRVSLALLALLLALPTAEARPRKKKAPAAEAAPAEPVQVPPLQSSRPDRLLVLHHEVPGPAVTIRLLLRVDGPAAEHVAPSAALIAGASVLHVGEPAAKLTAGGVDRQVEARNSTLVLGVDTIRERWEEDFTSFLAAVSNIPISEESALQVRSRVMDPVGAASVPELATALSTELLPHDPSIELRTDVPQDLGMDSLVWHVEELWSSDRMILVVTGGIPREKVDALVDAHFLVPGAIPREAPVTDPRAPLTEDRRGPGPRVLYFGQWARGVRPQDGLVIAAFIQQLLDADQQAAGACESRYVPNRAEPVVLVTCAEVRGQALDVRETLTHTFAPEAALTPVTAEAWTRARQLALTRLAAQRGSSVRMAARLGAWAAAGLDGGPVLEDAVRTAPDSALQESLGVLMEATRAIRVSRSPQAE